MSFFLICTTSFMQLRWWLGSAFLLIPVVAMHYLQGQVGPLHELQGSPSSLADMQ